MSEEEIKRLNLQTENAVKFGQYSFELEEKREQSIISQSGHMLTATALTSAAILMALPILLDIDSIPDCKIYFFTILSFFFLCLSFVCTILTQWRYSYQTMDNASVFFENFTNRQLFDYKNQYEFDKQWIYQLSSIQESKKSRNDLRVKLLKISMVCFLISIGIVIEGIVLLSLSGI